MNCSRCNWEHIIKYWSTSHTQRYLCHDCTSTFTIGWLKKQYSEEFITNVMEEYCHQHKIDLDLATFVSKRIALLDLDTLEPIYFVE